MGRGGLSNLWVNNLDWFCFDLLWHTKPSYILCQFLNYANKYKILNEFKVCYFPESLKSQYLWFLRDCLWSTLTGLGSFKYAPEALNWFLSQTALNLISFWKANSKKKKKKEQVKVQWKVFYQMTVCNVEAHMAKLSRYTSGSVLPSFLKHSVRTDWKADSGLSFWVAYRIV